MKMKCVFVMLLLFVIVLPVFAQQLDETLAPQAVQVQLQALRQEIEKNQYSFTVGYNEAMQYTIAQLCGFRVQEGWWTEAKSKTIASLTPQKLELEAAAVAAPAVWDWRDHNGVTAIRNQGSCGSCWAFGTIGTFESLLLIKQSLSIDLSEQWLVSCNSEGYGCNGGWWVHDMLVSPGAVLEADFPYVASDVACGGSYNHPYQLGGWAYIDGDDKVPSVDKIKDAIYNYGPVGAAVYVGSAFQAYTGGVFDQDEATTNGFFGCCDVTNQPNHAIVLVGWDDSKGAWILRNSWGSGWGINGYMYIKYGISLVGFSAVVVY